MRKFPEKIATKQDVDNIINHHPEYHTQLKAVLQRAYNEPTTADQVTDYDIDPATGEMINVVTKQIPRPNPKWQRMGFKSRSELNDIINTQLQEHEL